MEDGYVEEMLKTNRGMLKITPEGSVFINDEGGYTYQDYEAKLKASIEEGERKSKERKERRKERLENFNLWVKTFKNAAYLVGFVASVLVNVIFVAIPWVKEILSK